MTAHVSEPLIQRWIADVHEALAPAAEERTGAGWGPIRLRHRTVRPGWYGAYDRAWACPLASPHDAVHVDLVSAAFEDLPSHVRPPVIRRGELGPRGEVTALGNGPLRMVWDEAAGQVIAWDRDSGRALVLRLAPPDGYELVSPIRFLVHWAVASREGLLVHGATAGRVSRGASDGLLILGDAGFGKSTTTLAALERGWVTAGDDAVAVFADERGWRAYAIYGAVKTKLGTQGALDPLPIGPDVVTWEIHGRKRAHLLTDTDTGLLVGEMALRGLVVLDPDGDPDEPWEPVAAAVARSLGAPSTTIPLPYERGRGLERFGQLARELPAFRLPRRRDLGRTVADLDEMLASALPGVSVILPLYNGADFVTDAIDGVLAQRGVRFEIVVVDDASADDSVAVVEGRRVEVESAGHVMVVIRHPENRGVAAARNTGLQHATSEYVTFLDQDDVWRPGHTSTLLARRAASEADAVFGRMAFEALVPEGERGWMRPEWFEGDHRGGVVGCVLARRSVFDETGPFPDDNRTGTDDVVWLMRLRDSSLVVVDADDVVLTRRMHDRNQSRFPSASGPDLLAAVREHRRRAAAALARVDVVIPVHGTTQYLGAAVRTALAQEGVAVHVVIVDDGCDDDLHGLVTSWADDRVRLLGHGINRGAGAARNTGVEAGTAPWIAFLDADDLWPVDRMRLLLDAVGQPSREVIAYGSQNVFSDADEVDPSRSSVASQGERAPITGTLLTSRATFDHVGPFDETLRMGETIDWLARARELGVREVVIPEVTLLRRSHAANTTRTRSLDDYLRVVRLARERSGAAGQSSATDS